MRGTNYVKHRLCVIESAAVAQLTLAAHRVLLRLEIELLHNAGKNNGALIVTYNDFEQFGIRRKSIADAIRLLVKVGLVAITDRGWRAADHGRPARYRITYLPAYGKPPTDEWETYIPNHPRSGAKIQKLRVVAKSPLQENKIQGRKRHYIGGENAPTWTPFSRGRKRPYLLEFLPLLPTGRGAVAHSRDA
jgi:hypothetical protein